MKKITLNDFDLRKDRKLFNYLRKKDLLSDNIFDENNYTDAIYHLFKRECGKFDMLLKDEFKKMDDNWVSQFYYHQGEYYEDTIDYGLWQKFVRAKYKKSKNINQLEKIRGLLLNIRTWLWFNWNDETISMDYRWLGKWCRPKISVYKGKRYLDKDIVFLKRIRA